METFEYMAPNSLAEAISLWAKLGETAKLLAGGTDLVVQMKQGTAKPSCVIDLKKISQLNEIVFQKDQKLCLGSLVTADEIASSHEVSTHIPILGDVAGVIGSVQVRNRATIGGNLCRAAPSGDFAPILIVLGASLVIEGPEGERSMLVEDLFVGPGETNLRSGEIVAKILVPVPQEHSSANYQRHSYRETLDLALVGAAVYCELHPQKKTCQMARIALASSAPIPLRIRKAEEILQGQRITDDLLDQCARVAAEEAAPIDDVYGSAWYKKHIVEVMVRRGLKQALEDCG